MTSRNQTLNLKHIVTFVLAFVIFFGFATPVQAKENTPTLNSFIESVRDGNANVLRGVYVQDVMAFPVIQQAPGNPGYVSVKDKVITQFGMAMDAGNVGLLAHNYLAGKTFSSLASGNIVTLVYGDGHTEQFKITRVYQYQAMDPLSPTSNFTDLNTKATLSAEELFTLMYRGDRHVTFQTCIERDGKSSWGRLFVIAEPLSTTK